MTDELKVAMPEPACQPSGEEVKFPGMPPWPDSACSGFPIGDGLMVPLYSPTQVEAMLHAHGKAVQEWAAKVCDAESDRFFVEFNDMDLAYCAQNCAAAIRESK